jgi:hypothetical protein
MPTERRPTQVYTAPAAYRGDDRVDLRAGTTDLAGRLFAIPAELAGCGRRLTSDKSWDERRARYIDALRESYRTHRAAWLALRERREITFVCDCGERGWCLARVAAEILVRALPGLAALGGERELQRALFGAGGAR